MRATTKSFLLNLTNENNRRAHYDCVLVLMRGPGDAAAARRRGRLARRDRARAARRATASATTPFPTCGSWTRRPPSSRPEEKNRHQPPRPGAGAPARIAEARAMSAVAPARCAPRRSSPRCRRSRSTCTCRGACASARTAISTRTSAADDLPEREYVAALIARPRGPAAFGLGPAAVARSSSAAARRACSRPSAIDALLAAIRARLPLEPDAEITLEANPGTVEAARFRGYRDAGVNRLSLGVQSFDDAMLKALGRIHTADEARRAIEPGAGDLRQRQPRPDVRPAGPDARRWRARTSRRACARGTRAPLGLPAHASSRTRSSSRKPPQLPEHDAVRRHAARGRGDAAAARVSSTTRPRHSPRPGARCRHNLNYWEFGDYLGIGAGAHGKLSFADRVTRHERARQPREYLAAAGDVRAARDRGARAAVRVHAERASPGRGVRARALRGEHRAAGADDRERRCAPPSRRACSKEAAKRIRPTERGRLFLNDLVGLFLPAPE